MKRNIAVVLAAGVGKRIGLPMPKQFYEVAGRMVVEHTIDAFERNEHIDEIAIVAHTDYISDFEHIVKRNDWHKVKQILQGGKERSDSSLAAIRAYEEADVNIIFHDAARPMVSQRLINDIVSALDSYAAATVAIPTADTIIQIDGGVVGDIPDRSRLRRVQTPQGFHIGTIRSAYEKALCDPAFRATDDCGVVYRYLPDVPICVVEGDGTNIKLTYKEDLFLLERLLQHSNIE